MIPPPISLTFICFIAYVSSFVLFPEAFRSPTLEVQPVPHAGELTDETPLPVVIWHGLGDRFDADGMKDVAKLIDEVNPGTYVHIIQLGDDGDSDRSASFFGNVTEQVEMVCQQLVSDPILRTAPAIDVLGFSQGGQFLRGYVERCNNPPVRNLVTFGSQHNGIAAFQNCDAGDFVCRAANALLQAGKWSDFVQSRLVPAQYFRDPADLDQYLEHSNYLADINNERSLKTPQYAENIKSLNKFVMYIFKDDKTTVPKESSWFAEYNTTSKVVTPLKERPIYKNDWLGLKALDEKGGLVFDSVEGEHMQLSKEDLEMAFRAYFGPVKGSSQRSDWRPGRSLDSIQAEL